MQVVDVRTVTPGATVNASLLAVANISTPVPRRQRHPAVLVALAVASTTGVAVTPVTPGTAVPVSAKLADRSINTPVLCRHRHPAVQVPLAVASMHLVAVTTVTPGRIIPVNVSIIVRVCTTVQI